MPVKRLVPGSDDVLTQDTDFSRDVSGRYVCNNFTEAEKYGEAGYQRVKNEFSMERHIQTLLVWYDKGLKHDIK